jgi:REP element-mobilizing transposase RayT
MMIHAGAINRDHVHLLISIPPYLSVSRSVQFLKGKSSHKLLTFQVLRAVLGPTFVEQGILGLLKWKCYRRGVEEVHRGSEAGRARRQFQSSLTNRPEGSIISGFQP